MNVTRVSFIEYPGWTLEFNSSDELQKKKKLFFEKANN